MRLRRVRLDRASFVLIIEMPFILHRVNLVKDDLNGAAGMTEVVCSGDCTQS